MIFRVHYMRVPALRGHVYCRVYVAPCPKTTFASMGSLTMRHDEFDAFREAFRAEYVEDVPGPEWSEVRGPDDALGGL